MQVGPAFSATATRAPATCRAPASPRSWVTSSPSAADPIAPKARARSSIASF
ncbi:MAG TPA: hypothetical protein VD931_19850 [Baekduia sp.]|nr:hypothetical protein [Baekduia sp.]